MRDSVNTERSFGDLKIKERTEETFLSEEEKVNYKRGFENLKNLVASMSLKDKLKRFNTNIVSLIVGYQPIISGFSIEELELMRKNLPSSEYRFYGSWNNHPNVQMSEIVGINVKTARMVLGISANVSDEEMLKDIGDIFRQGGTEANKLLGKLSGYPSEDVEKYAEERKPRESEKMYYDLENIDTYLEGKGQGTKFRYMDGIGSMKEFVIKILERFQKDRPKDNVMGYGIIWISSNPPSAAAERQCQKLMEMDRMVGLTKFMKGVNPLTT